MLPLLLCLISDNYRDSNYNYSVLDKYSPESYVQFCIPDIHCGKSEACVSFIENKRVMDGRQGFKLKSSFYRLKPVKWTSRQSNISHQILSVDGTQRFHICSLKVKCASHGHKSFLMYDMSSLAQEVLSIEVVDVPSADSIKSQKAECPRGPGLRV